MLYLGKHKGNFTFTFTEKCEKLVSKTTFVSFLNCFHVDFYL